MADPTPAPMSDLKPFKTELMSFTSELTHLIYSFQIEWDLIHKNL